MMSPIEWFEQFHAALLKTRCKVAGREVPLAEGLKATEDELLAARKRGAGVWWIGNGGSSALCSHLSQDLLNKLGMRSLVLSDAALITCMANDYGYGNVYTKPLGVLVQPGDLLIAVSSGGRSANILGGVGLAREKRLKTITLSAFEADNPLWAQPSEVAFYLPTKLYGHAEVGHEALLHSVIETTWLKERKN